MDLNHHSPSDTHSWDSLHWIGRQKLILFSTYFFFCVLFSACLLNPPPSISTYFYGFGSSVISCLCNKILYLEILIFYLSPIPTSAPYLLLSFSLPFKQKVRIELGNLEKGLRQSRRQKEAKLSGFCFPKTQGAWEEIRGFAKEKREEGYLQV